MKVGKVVAQKLRDDENWQKYIKSIILPVVKLEKGKLCFQDDDRSTSSFGNIFGDNEFDFGNLATGGASLDRENTTEEKKEDNDDA